MSEKKVKANKRPDYAPQRGPGHGPMAGGGEKAANFTVSLRRLIRQLRPQRVAIVAAIVLGTISVALGVVGPKILGRATDLMLAGITEIATGQPGANAGDSLGALRVMELVDRIYAADRHTAPQLYTRLNAEPV